ncbi:MAG TPA: hypothetical protein DEG69_07315 [Flavobacteriaceae bacterium]|nr:hypothetical protein [Flavobacteriaceae bacterium]|tara:strand:- start:568 stop:957 length:390 start_codon:yes stop_codon:yes gene_type:complete
MEKQFNNEEEFTKNLFKKVGTQQPSQDFASQVMKTIKLKSKPQAVYQPLISKKGWCVVGSCIAISAVCIFLFPLGGFSEIKIDSFKAIFSFKYTFPQIELPNIMVYAIAFIALFLVEIPFLKRLLDKPI